MHNKPFIADSYLELLYRFPLRPIRSGKEYDQAVEVARELALLGEDRLDSGQRDYLDALDQFIEIYDAIHHKIERSTLTTLSRLELLMKETKMSVSGLGRILGSQPAASLMLSGKRELSKIHVRKLANHFKLNPGYFL
jgi:HTH-type transcriptional regulator / antitoxin HigA